MDSKVGLIIQLNGVFVVTVMCILLSRSLRLEALKHWTIAWLCLSFSLISLRLGFDFDALGSLFITYYYLGQYIFGFLLIAGCRSLDGNWQLRRRYDVAAAPFLALSVALPAYSGDFNALYALHAVVMSGFFGAAFLALRRTTLRSFGWKLMHVSLAALVVDHLAYAIVDVSGRFGGADTSVLAYASAVDLVLQTSLGVGMVAILLEKVLSDARSAHERLESNNRRLEELVHTDPLTAAFSRHAFYGFVKKQGDANTETSGCVGFFDIDDLKYINDRFGHGVGDMAIRTVAKVIREIVRAEDLIFRWGGDEFFVIMISMDAEMAAMRMTRLESELAGITIEGVAEPVSIGVSWGFTDFEDISMLEDAINRADSAMYARKLERKKRRKQPRTFVPEFAKPSHGLSI